LAVVPSNPEAAALLAAVVGQDLDRSDGVFQIVRRVAKHRIIPTVGRDAVGVI
jgi:hypothetical protein